MSRHPTANAGKTMLGRYRIERELGRGGMGVVYVATDVNTGRLVALKTTSVAGLGSGEKTRNQRRERFIREVRALTQVNHPNVVHVFDAGEVDDPDLGWLLFYTMEYVEGTTLAALVQERGALGGGEAAAVVSQVAHGLGEAHRQGIIHRDVKPANIFLSNDGRALIGDFGIAKIEGSTQITRRDQLVGTPNYLAPEQILGEAVGPATDVFALGALFYVITQNRPLRQQVDAGALLASANGNEPVARMKSAQGLPDALKDVVARCLERDPTRRYVDGTGFAEALAEHASRVPILGPRPERANFLEEGTNDRSSAFLSSDPSVPDADMDDIEDLPDAELAAGDVNSVEAAAMAMLGEVERRATGTFKQPDRKTPDAPLPVAQTESTVMFNMRAMEESAPAPAPKKKQVPVAKTESTQVVVRARIDLEPLTDPNDDNDPVEIVPRRRRANAALNGPTVLNDDEQPPVSTSGAPTRPMEQTAPTVTAKPTPRGPLQPPAPSPFAGIQAQLATVPRRFLIAATFAGGAMLGLIVAGVLKPDHDVTVAVPDEGDALGLALVPLTPRPALCPKRDPTPEQMAQAAALLDEAKTARGEGKRESLILEKLRAGMGLDPTNRLLFYEFGRLNEISPKERDDADECVCQIDPQSKECGDVEKARGR